MSESPEDQGGTERDTLAEAEACEADRRLWVRTILPLLQARSAEPDPSDRVQLALDRVQIAAAERLVRILRSDLGPDQR